MCKISLLLTTYNCADTLPGTFRSILHQTFQDIEVVIADGDSADGTKDLIKSFASDVRIPVIWTSEPDKGLYDALNKTVRMANGEYLLVCNDCLAKKDSLEKLVCAAESGDYCGAHADLVYTEGRRVRRYWHMGNSRRIHTGWMPGHPTLLLKREIYERFGDYKTDYRISADYEFMMRFLKHKEYRLAYVPEVLVNMYYGGTSTARFSDYVRSFHEGCRALYENHISFPLLTTGLRTVRVLLQFRH